MVDLRIFSDLNELSRAAAEEVVRLAGEAVQQSGLFTVALSGGSTPRSLYALLADDPVLAKQLPCDRMYFFWGDERAVPPDHPDCNYRMAHETMLSKLPVPEANVHRIHAESMDAHKAAADYDSKLREFFRLSPGELPRLDLVLLGMGADGHTASLFPRSAALREKEKLAVNVRMEKLKSHRVTLVPPVFNHAIHVLFLVSGAEKAEALKAVLEGEYQPDQVPSQLIRPAYGKLTWMVDQAAAGKLSPSSFKWDGRRP